MKAKNLFKDNEGNILVNLIQLGSNKILHVSVYRPNQDENYFFNKVKSIIDTNMHLGEGVIINGDFNLVLNEKRDSKGYKHHNYPNTRKSLLNLMNSLSLSDIAGKLSNSPEHTYTTSNTAEMIRNNFPHKKTARLDFFLISNFLQENCREIVTYSKGLSDHRPVQLSYSEGTKTKKPNLWILNKELLQFPETVKKIEAAFNTIKLLAETFPSEPGEQLATFLKDSKKS